MKRIRFLLGAVVTLLATPLSLFSCNSGSDSSSDLDSSNGSSDSSSSITILWQNWDGSLLEKDTDVEYGSMPSYDGPTPTREDSSRGGSGPQSDKTFAFNANADSNGGAQYAEYVFSGWYPEIVPATKDAIYVAQFDVTFLAAHVYFDLNGGETASDTSSRYMSTIDASNFFFNVTKEGYNFRGWEYDGERIFDGRGNKLKDVDIAKEMTFKAVFAQNSAVYITTNISEAGEVMGAGEYDYNATVNVSATPNQGYAFVGWYYQGAFLSTCQDYGFVIGKDDIVLVAKFEIRSFTMRIASNNDECGLVSLDSSKLKYYSFDSGKYVYKSVLSIAAYSKSDVRFLGWYDANNALVSTNPVYSFYMPGYDYYLEAKWNLFKIEYDLDGGVQNDANPTSYTLEEGPLTLYAPTKTKTGYTFLGWYDGDKLMPSIDKGTIGNLKLTAKWSANLNTLSVTSEDETKGMVEIVSGFGYTDEAITVKATPIGDWVFWGWYCDSVMVSAKEVYSFVMSASDCRLIAKFWTEAEQEERNKALGIVPALDEANGTLTYGLYPQTHVSDAATIAALDSLKCADINGWYLCDGQYYAKETAKPRFSDYVFDDGAEIVSGTSYWFKCEPIIWKILSSGGGNYSLVSSLLLDAHRYNEYYSGTKGGYYANNYANSEIREWLNGDFYSAAFALDDSHVQTTIVDNSAATTGSSSNKYACENTEDNVYLLSYQDYYNPSYFANNASRECKTTDYARARGACYNTESSYFYNGLYWTRSPTPAFSYLAWHVGSDGSHGGSFSGGHVDYSYYAVRPAISITL